MRCGAAGGDEEGDDLSAQVAAGEGAEGVGWAGGAARWAERVIDMGGRVGGQAPGSHECPSGSDRCKGGDVKCTRGAIECIAAACRKRTHSPRHNPYAPRVQP